MYVTEISLNNFTSYYGRHVLRLDEGINYIVGVCGSGRTNLARAFQFAVLGSSDFRRKSLVNSFHRHEVKEKGGRCSCEVEVDLWIKGKKYLCQNTLAISTDGEIIQSSTNSLDVDYAINPEKYELIYLNTLDMKFDEKDANKLPSVRILNALTSHLKYNVDEGIGMVILDQVMDHFDYDKVAQMQDYLSGLKMDQVILIDSLAHEQQDKNRHRVVQVVESKGTSQIVEPLRADLKLESFSSFEQAQMRFLLKSLSPKESIEQIREQLAVQVRKVEQETEKFYEGMKGTAAIAANHEKRKDVARANVYYCVLAERATVLRKMVEAKLALQKTFELLGEFTSDLSSLMTFAIAVELFRNAGKVAPYIMPIVDKELSEIESVLKKVADVFFLEELSKVDFDGVNRGVDAFHDEIVGEAGSVLKELFSAIKLPSVSVRGQKDKSQF